MSRGGAHGWRAAPRRRRREGGFVTIETLAAIALSFALLAVVANLLTFQYARGVVRAALDEGVRAGARLGGGAAACEQRAADVLGDLLGGPLGAGVAVGCAEGALLVSAEATVRLLAWAPLVPDWTFSARAEAVRERAP